MIGVGVVRPYVSKGGCIAKGHGESVVGSMGKELVQGFFREFGLVSPGLGSRAVELLGWVSERLVEDCQHLFS